MTNYHDPQAIHRTLYKAGVATATSEIKIRPVSRAMSRLWRVVVSDSTGKRNYILKTAGAFEDKQAQVTDRQAHILKLITDCSRDDGFSEIVYLGYSPEERLLLLQESTLPVLSEAITSLKISQSISGYPKLRQGVRLAGRWLRRWHDMSRSHGPIAEKLTFYLQERMQRMSCLPPSTRDKLFEVARDCPAGDLVMTHSDFTLHNLLSDGSKLAVLDPGIWEWSTMSPYWDIATFQQSLEQLVHFSWPRPISWRSSTLAGLQSDFLDSYGITEKNNLVHQNCSALRYLVNYLNYHQRGDKKSKQWYLAKLEKNLADRNYIL